MKMSLASQLIIAHESGVTNTVDPMAGSYFLDSLTQTIEERVWEYLNKIEELGGGPENDKKPKSLLRGMLRAIETGYIEQEISSAAYEYQRRVESSDYVVVGVNQYRSEQTQPLEIFEYDTREEDRQLERLGELRRERDNPRVQKLLDETKTAAEADENLMPPVLAAVRAGASEGEIMDSLRDVYGSYRDPGVF